MNFPSSFKKELFTITERNFNEKALELFNYQAENNAVYKNYLQLLNKKPSSVSSITEIPFLPIQLFKTYKILTGDEQFQLVFFSSGTTGQERSAHYVKDPDFYKEVSREAFRHFYGNLSDYSLLALLPSYLENKSSSLIYMIEFFIQETRSSNSGFVLNEVQSLKRKIGDIRQENKKLLLWGVSYALLDMAEKHTIDLSDAVVLETGGMKGRREELIREDLHQLLTDKFNVSRIHSEYGMTELLSQAYSLGEGVFATPPWMKILIRELNDPFELKATAGTGGVNVIDLANIDSCAFIETQDVGSLNGKGEFEIRGRFDNAEVRGCNLMYTG